MESVSRRFWIFMVLCAAVIMVSARPAEAQIQTYYYQGPAFSLTDCGFDFCINGHETGTLVFSGLPANYTGVVDTSKVTSWTMSASGIGTLNTSNYLSPISGAYQFSNGQMVNWQVVAATANVVNPPIQITTASGTGNYDEAALYETPPANGPRGLVYNPPQGFWTNPKVLGIACAHSGSASCGEPIDLGSGNMFTQVQDYTTAGQNPLAFTRFYNSMSMPDTYAVALGTNWRSTFDRYLHIIPPTSIVGVEVERPDGQVINFQSNSGVYTTDSDLDYSLSVSGSTWTLTDPDDTVETYSSSGGVGTLQTIKLRNGYTLTMHYTSGALTSVTDSYSRSLGLSYSSTGLLTGLTTPDNANLTYGYVSYLSTGLLTAVSYNTTPVTSQTYLYENTSYPTALTGITNENNNRYATWTYDGKGRALTSQLAGGINFTSVSYDDTTGNRIVQGPLGVQETYEFSYLQGVPKVTEIDRAANGTVTFSSQHFSYDSNGYLSNQPDWNGNNTSYVNNTHGLPTQITYASTSGVAHTTNITYDTTWARLAHVITTPGLTTTLNYDSSGNLSTRVDTDTTTQSIPYSTNGQTRTTTYTYTSTGQLASVKLPRTDVSAKTAFNYSGGALSFTSDALSHITTVNTHTAGGYPTKITDPNSVITTITYSSRMWLTGNTVFVSSGSLTTSLTYDSAGNLTKDTLPDGSYLSYGYNAAHLLTSLTNPLGENQALTYDSAGNLTQVLWKNASAVTQRQHTATYDAAARMLTNVGGMSQTTTYGYDSQGNVTSITDPLSHITNQTFDALNRQKGLTDADLNFTSTSYDAHDRPVAIKDPRGFTTSYVYDGFGDLIQQTSPDTGTTVYTYNADGDLIKQVDASSAETDFTYDALDRMLTRTYPAQSSLNVSYTWDQTGHGFGIGRLTSLTDPVGSLSRTFEQRGLLTVDSRTFSSHVYTTDYSYESAGRLSGITYASSGWLINYTRDSAGQISMVSSTQPSHSAVNMASSITHMPFGPVASMTFGNGVTDTRTYDLDYRMTSVKDVGTGGNILYLSYGYDADNNTHTITDNVTTANNQTLTYDPIDQLKSAVGSYGTVSSITYDSNQNLLTYGTTTNTFSSTSNQMLTSGASSISYSSTGNMTTIGSNTAAYNKANQLSSFTASGSTMSFLYDAFGQRVQAQIGSSKPTIYQNDQAGNVLMESINLVDTDYAYLDGFPIAAIQAAAGTFSAMHTDRLGTPQKATNASQTVGWTGNYKPFGSGTFTGSTNQNLRYPGMIASNAVFPYLYNGFRNYDAGGQYMEADPIGMAGGINPYIYVRNNPFKWTDNLGLTPPDPEFPQGVAPASPGEPLEVEKEIGPNTAGHDPYNPTALPTPVGVVLGNGNTLPHSEPPPATPPIPTTGAQCSVSPPGGGALQNVLMPGGQLLGQAGSRPSIREVRGGVEDAQALFEQITQGGTVLNSSYPGTSIQLPNGTIIGIRTISTNSPGTAATIDIQGTDFPISKIKFNP